VRISRIWTATARRSNGSSAPRGAPEVVVYNAALPDPGEILDTTVERLRTAHDVDVLGAVVAAQVAAPVLRAAGGGTLLVTSGGFADNPVPALASLSMGKAALRSAQTLIAAGVREDDIHAATVTIAGVSSRGRTSIRTTSRSSSGPPAPTRRTPGRLSIGSQAHSGAPTPTRADERSSDQPRSARCTR
jgi:NAD(P)-dependent dehydrogenase (short-subunit alcohol dehydrogenase family)